MRYSSKSQYFTFWGYPRHMDDNTWKLCLPKWWGYNYFWMRYFNTYLYIWKFPKIDTHPPISAILGPFIVKKIFLEILWKSIGVAVGFGLTVLYSTSNCTVTIYIENCAGMACLTVYLNDSLGTTIAIHHKLSK